MPESEPQNPCLEYRVFGSKNQLFLQPELNRDLTEIITKTICTLIGPEIKHSASLGVNPSTTSHRLNSRKTNRFGLVTWVKNGRDELSQRAALIVLDRDALRLGHPGDPFLIRACLLRLGCLEFFLHAKTPGRCNV